jgi:hypothetical protein
LVGVAAVFVQTTEPQEFHALLGLPHPCAFLCPVLKRIQIFGAAVVIKGQLYPTATEDECAQ